MRSLCAAIVATGLLLPLPAGAFTAKSVEVEGVQLVAAKKKKAPKKKSEEKMKAAPSGPSY
jgi:hypothetical protein